MGAEQDVAVSLLLHVVGQTFIQLHFHDISIPSVNVVTVLYRKGKRISVTKLHFQKERGLKAWLQLICN